MKRLGSSWCSWTLPDTMVVVDGLQELVWEVQLVVDGVDDVVVDNQAQVSQL